MDRTSKSELANLISTLKNFEDDLDTALDNVYENGFADGKSEGYDEGYEKAKGEFEVKE